MRLNYAPRRAYRTYPWTSGHAAIACYQKRNSGGYAEEDPALLQITEKLGLPPLGDQCWARSPLVYLVEAADDICYALIDLEDGLEMELLRYSEVEDLLLGLVGDDLPETYRLLGPQDSTRR